MENPKVQSAYKYMPSTIAISRDKLFSLSFEQRLIKRCVDIAGAILGLVLFFPFLPFIALAIFLDSPGPIFFSQNRLGKNGKPFQILKFRSMHYEAEKKTGAIWAMQGDPRITRIGSILRKLRLDEIPQLINVLKGQMSLTGPRPERPEFIERLQKYIPNYTLRHIVKPGITGLAQISYPYGASIEDARKKLCYDLFYIQNYSLALECKILLCTIWVMCSRNGAR